MNRARTMNRAPILRGIRPGGRKKRAREPLTAFASRNERPRGEWRMNASSPDLANVSSV